LLPQVTDAFGSYSTSAGDFFKQLATGFQVTASLVCDAQGITVDGIGSSKGIGNLTDLALLVALRRQAEVILTSGATFRADEYRFPKSADLAVLTNKDVDIAVPTGHRLHQLNSSYVAAVEDLRRLSYTRIHVEYGFNGISELVNRRKLDALVLSSPTRQGVPILAAKLGVNPVYIELNDLYVGLVAWQTDRLQS
jgi:riboflavin biosynthesis pyrimidine reductase